MLDWFQFTQCFVTQFLEKLVLELAGALVCPEDFCLHFLQLGGDETFAAHGGLLARVMGGHAGQIRLGYFDKIAEDRIVTHLERFDPSGDNLALLQLANPIFPVPRSLTKLVEIDIVSIAKNPAFLERQRRIVDNCAREFFGKLRHLLNFALKL